MPKYNLESIHKCIVPINVVGLKDFVFDNAATIFDGNRKSISWIKSSLKNYKECLSESKSVVIICDENILIPEDLKSKKCFIVCNNPKLAFVEIIENLFAPSKIKSGIHSTAIIHKDAIIDKSVRVEPYCIIGRSTIGKNCIIQSHSVIRDNCFIGNNVVIHSHVVIGSDGFGFIREPNGGIKKFPHLGKVIIEDDVEIYPFTNVDIGTLGATKIRRGTKIDHYCHISHNTEVGENTIITAGTILCGGSKVGNNSFIGINTVVKEKENVMDNTLTGIGSVITKTVPMGETWLGSPAQSIIDFKKERVCIKELIKKDNKV